MIKTKSITLIVNTVLLKKIDKKKLGVIHRPTHIETFSCHLLFIFSRFFFPEGYPSSAACCFLICYSESNAKRGTKKKVQRKLCAGTVERDRLQAHPLGFKMTCSLNNRLMCLKFMRGVGLRISSPLNLCISSDME